MLYVTILCLCRANASSRHTRGADTPAPIDCKLKSWTQWSPCDSCRDNMVKNNYSQVKLNRCAKESLGFVYCNHICVTFGKKN